MFYPRVPKRISMSYQNRYVQFVIINNWIFIPISLLSMAPWTFSKPKSAYVANLFVCSIFLSGVIKKV